VRSDESNQTTKTTHRKGTENTAGETAKLTRAQTTNLMKERMGNWNEFLKWEKGSISNSNLWSWRKREKLLKLSEGAGFMNEFGRL